MIKLGITGGIGSGKSTVSSILSLFGIPVYMADVESKRLVNTSSVIREKLIREFGVQLFDGSVLNRELLASHIFSDRAKLELVNKIIHPEVEKDFKKWCKKNSNFPIIAQEAAILFESGFNRLMDKTITVYTCLEMRIERVMTRDNISKEKVMERINSQMPDEQKVKLSDFVIINDETQSLIEQTVALLQKLGYKC